MLYIVGDHAKGPVLKSRLQQTLVVKQEFHCQTLGNRCEFQGSLEMMALRRMARVSQKVWHVKKLCYFFMIAEIGSNFAALHGQQSCYHMIAIY